MKKHPTVNSASPADLASSRLRSRLASKSRLDTHTGCLEWTGTCSTNTGYGRTSYRGKPAYVHRCAAILYLSFVPNPGMFVLHSCDNPRCFNPDHLFIGTQADNMRDATLKGRMSKKLRVDQVVEIKQLLGQNVTHKAIAERFGVSRVTITQIANGQTWAHVEVVGQELPNDEALPV